MVSVKLSRFAASTAASAYAGLRQFASFDGVIDGGSRFLLDRITCFIALHDVATPVAISPLPCQLAGLAPSLEAVPFLPMSVKCSARLLLFAFAARLVGWLWHEGVSLCPGHGRLRAAWPFLIGRLA